jgi:EmrB/QacA subfamily drug resistance transporter
MTHTAPTVERAAPSRTLAILALSAMAYALAQTMIIPALPSIQTDYGASQEASTWLLTIFLLTSSVSTPLLGRLGDMYGKERILLYALGVFGLGSLICALGSTIGVLILGRAVQGAGGAIFPLAFGIIRDEFPRERVPSSIGLISSTFGIGGGAGLILAGLLVDHLSVPWIFWSSLLATTIAAVATWRFVPESPVRIKARIDWGGGALLSLVLASGLLGVSQGNAWGWTSGRVLGLFAACAVLLVAFIAYERRVEDPVIDMDLMRERAVWSTNLAAVAVGFAMFGSYVLIPQLAEASKDSGYGFGLSTTSAGLVLVPSAVIMLFAGPMSGYLGTRFGSRLPLALGAACAGTAYALLAVAHGSIYVIAAVGILIGIGIGLAFAAMANLVVQAVSPEVTGVATGVNTIMRSIGGAVGAQISASLLASKTILDGRFPAESGYTAAFAMTAVAAFVALAVTALIPVGRGIQATMDAEAAAEAEAQDVAGPASSGDRGRVAAGVER